MLYFIPAWYQDNTWSENEQKWYVRREHTEFDDTVKQVQLFHRSKAQPYNILLLNFAPNFRHFIHRQSVYHASYWSCFDAIQEITRKKAMLLSFHNLNWPENIEFVYTPFVVLAFLKGEKYAQIEFGEDGNPILIDIYDKGELHRRNIYDDRGFVSSTIIFNDSKPVYQDYLMENGMWKMRYFYGDGHVDINQKCNNFLLINNDTQYKKAFSKDRYNTLDEVIYEVFVSYLGLLKEEDIFCVAMHNRHDIIINEALKDKKVILSFFQNRYDLETYQGGMEMLDKANYIVADSQDNELQLKIAMQKFGINNDNICNITPFDTRVDFGISQQLNVQKILVPIDGIGEKVFEALIQTLGKYIPHNENVQVILFTRMADYNMESKLLKMARHSLRHAGMEEEWARPKSKDTTENELESQEDIVKQRFFVEQCVDELAVSKCMREQRLVVDMRKIPELYIQIAAISVGIPQLVRSKTQFIEHGKNGVILEKLKELPGALGYYLNGLKNWNNAMVASYELGKRYTTDVLIKQWKEVIDHVG